MSKAKPVFFVTMRGLRGCYMPDDVSHNAVRTFEEFRKALKYDVEFAEMAWSTNDKNEQSSELIEALLREAWEHVTKRPSALPLCVAISSWDNEDGTPTFDESYGLLVGGSSASEYRDYCREMRNS